MYKRQPFFSTFGSCPETARKPLNVLCFSIDCLSRCAPPLPLLEHQTTRPGRWKPTALWKRICCPTVLARLPLSRHQCPPRLLRRMFRPSLQSLPARLANHPSASFTPGTEPGRSPAGWRSVRCMTKFNAVRLRHRETAGPAVNSCGRLPI